MDLTDPEVHVDHIHHDTLDNRKSELRKVTPAENAQNRKVRTDSSTGFPGVTWHKATGKWYARIGKDGKRIDLGCYSDIEEAIQARKDAEKEYFDYRAKIDVERT